MSKVKSKNINGELRKQTVNIGLDGSDAVTLFASIVEGNSEK